MWTKNYWLDLNYLHVARAALDCSAYLSAILYADIWEVLMTILTCAFIGVKYAAYPFRRCQNQRVSVDVTAVERSVSANAAANILEIIYAQNPEEGTACQAVLYEAYQNLGDVDALYGCGNGFLLDESGRINHLAQEGKFFKAMGRHGVFQVRMGQVSMCPNLRGWERYS